jgi:hypothetical protein
VGYQRDDGQHDMIRWKSHFRNVGNFKACTRRRCETRDRQKHVWVRKLGQNIRWAQADCELTENIYKGEEGAFIHLGRAGQAHLVPKKLPIMQGYSSTTPDFPTFFFFANESDEQGTCSAALTNES